MVSELYLISGLLFSVLKFHNVHGKNVRITNNGRTALRPQPFTEFTDAVVLSDRPLRNDEMFSIRIEKIVDRWSGSIEAGTLLTDKY